MCEHWWKHECTNVWILKMCINLLVNMCKNGSKHGVDMSVKMCERERDRYISWYNLQLIQQIWLFDCGLYNVYKYKVTSCSHHCNIGCTDGCNYGIKYDFKNGYKHCFRHRDHPELQGNISGWYLYLLKWQEENAYFRQA